ncbi:MAG: hypothetical protein LHV68_00900 [Elusimicrobia bacterium]|nr:hypothetical protein [Candidatus Liberimonas magnetica]
MSKKQTSKKQNEELLTRKEFIGIHEEFKKDVNQRFEKVENALQNQAKAILKNSDDIKIIKETMSTKDDVEKILTAIDSFA